LNVLEHLARQGGWHTGRWTGPPAPYIPLACDYDMLFNRLRPREQGNLRKRFAKLTSLGHVQLEVVTSETQIAEAMRDGLRIEAAAWKEQAGTAIVSDSRVQRFYTQFAERAATLGYLRLAFLRVGRKRIAFFYLLDCGGVVYAMKVGYDPEFHAYSPGHMLLMLILKEACDEGRREFDFQGTAERWKLVWTTETRRYPWLFMFRDRWRTRLLHRAKFVILPAVRGFSRSGEAG
jgi:CelD/BcsL family acetyltransferase involved in cellulose biosynthesis